MVTPLGYPPRSFRECVDAVGGFLATELNGLDVTSHDIEVHSQVNVVAGGLVLDNADWPREACPPERPLSAVATVVVELSGKGGADKPEVEVVDIADRVVLLLIDHPDLDIDGWPKFCGARPRGIGVPDSDGTQALDEVTVEVRYQPPGSLRPPSFRQAATTRGATPADVPAAWDTSRAGFMPRLAPSEARSTPRAIWQLRRCSSPPK